MKLDPQAERVWRKGVFIPDKDEYGKLKWSPDEWRRDYQGNAIKHDDYGDRGSKFGWEIDHIVAVVDGGSDDIDNLRPLQWAANVARN